MDNITHKSLSEKECEDKVKKLHKDNPDMYISLKEWKKKRKEIKKKE